jgi:hypothetical protein
MTRQHGHYPERLATHHEGTLFVSICACCHKRIVHLPTGGVWMVNQVGFFTRLARIFSGAVIHRHGT